MKKPTIKDIAKLAGVSDTTVSNVVNNRKGRVSEETRKKIEKAIAKLNYKTNYAAKSLAHNRSNLVGIIIPQMEENQRITLENTFYGEIISNLECGFRKLGYYTILAGVGNNESDTDFIVKWNLDAAIVFGVYDGKFYRNIKKTNIPVVLMDSFIEDDYFYQVNTDDKNGGYLAGKYLLEKGHKKLAIITGELRKNGVMYERYEGFKKVLEEYELDIVDVYSGTTTYEWGEKVGEMLDPSKVTAVFSAADIISVGFLSSLIKRNIRVPEEVSIISFDNTYLSEICMPKLTSIDQSLKKKSEILVRKIQKLLQEDSGIDTKKRTVLDVKIVERDSVSRK